MAFPTTSVLTNFTGTDEDPLSEGGNFSGPVESGDRLFRRVSNEVARSDIGSAGTGNTYWTPTTFGADTEVFATMSVLPATGGTLEVWGRIHNPNNPSLAECYLVHYMHGSGFRLYKFTSGTTFTPLTSYDATAASAGDKIGLEIVGTQVTAYHYTGGAWNTRGSASDSAVTGAGYIGMSAYNDTAGRLDDFGGGTVIAANAPTLRTVQSPLRW